MNKVKNSWLNLIALLVLALFAANAAQKKRTPVYHSTLDSAAAIETPAVGATGVCWNVEFREGVKGNALYVPAGTSTIRVPFGNGLPARAGCIEFWAKILPSGPSFIDGGNPRFFNFTTPGTDASSLAFLEINANNGSARGGWHLVFSEVWQTTGYMVYNSYPQIFGDLDYADWHHYVLKWNVDGLATASDKAFVFELDGNTMLSQEKEGLDVDKFCATLSQPLELLLPLQFNTRVPGDCRVPYLIDEFKVWDSDVIGEEEPEPDPGTDPDPALDDGVDVVDGVTWYYTLTDGNAMIVKGAMPYAGDLSTPQTLDGHPVKAIGENAFRACPDLVSVVVSDGVETIGRGAFAANPLLVSVTLPDSVTFIDVDGFSDSTKLSQVNLPPHITKLSVYTFHATAITEVAIPEGVTAIEHDAFLQCANLEIVTLPSTLKFIDWSGFQRASALKRIEFPEGFERFGCLSAYADELHAAFGNCTSLAEAIFNGPLPANFTYSWLDKLGCKIWYPKAYEESWVGAVPAEKFGGYTEDYGKEPGSGPDDPDPALNDGIDVVDGVTWYYTLDANGNASIVKGAILYAGDLKTPQTLDGHPVKGIAQDGFIDCTGLTSIVVQDGVEYIGSGAFARNPNLVRAILPDSATNIVESCFYQCYSLAEYRIPQRLPFICRFFFHGTAIKKIDIPEGVVRIGDNAFWLCEQLEEVTLPSTLTFIDWSAFHSCPLLKRIEFPEGFEGFGVWTLRDEAHAAFGNCTGLEEAIFNGPLPTNFTYSWLDKLGCKIWYPKAYEASWAGAVPAEKFGGYTEDYGNEPGPGPDDPSLNDGVDVIDGVTWYYTLADGNATIIKGEIAYAGDITTPTTLDGHPVKAIGENAFRASPDLVSVVVSDGVETVGRGAFAANPLLVSVTLPDSVTFIDVDGFSDSTKLSQVNLPPHITKLSVYTFHATAITEVAIPEGVTTIDHDAFLQCANLETVTLPSTLKFIDWSGFQRASALKRIEFPEGFERFGCLSAYADELHAAFGNCTSLAEAIFNGPLPANFTYSWLDKLGCKIWYPKAYEESWVGAVPAEKFGGYTEDYGKEPGSGPDDPDPALNDGIDVVDGVTWYYTLDAAGNATIVKGAILYAGDLTTPQTLDGHPVKGIAKDGFIDCTGLTSIVVRDGVEYIGSGAFARNPNLVRAILPDSATNIVESCFYQCYSLAEYRIPQRLPFICRFFFHGTAIKKIDIPEGVARIGDNAFWLCEQLEEVTLPSTLKFIDWSGFQRASALKRIEFPEGFEGFGVWTLRDEAHAAFGNCTGLEEAIFNGPLPTNFTYSWLDKLGCKIWYPRAYEESWAGAVPAEKFGGYTEDYGNEPGPVPDDPSLNDGVDVVDGVTWYYTLADGVATIVKGAILYAGDLTTPTTLDGHPVKAIGESAFRACPDLVSVVVSDGVEMVDRGAFAANPLLVNVTLPDSVTFIDVASFSDSTKLSQVNLPPHITKLSVYTFHATAITEVAIPEGVTTIEHDAFLQCANLETVTLPSTLKFIDWSGFQRASALKRIEFPEGFEGFGVWTLKDEAHAAFGYCTNLSEAVFNGPLPTNFTYSWLDKLGCKIWYPKAYEESWAGAVPAEKFGGYTEDYGKEPEPEPEPEEIEFKTIADGGYDIGVAIKPVAVTYNGGAANAKIALAGLPNGLAFKNGAISGVPTMPGFYTVKAIVTAGKKTVADKSVKMRVKNYTDPLAEGLPDYLGEFIPGVSVDITLEPVKGWKAVTLPAGLKFAPSTGRITGAPTKPGVFTVCFTKTYGYAVHAASSTMTVLPLRRLVVAKEGSGTVKGAGRYLANAKVKLTATPAKKMAVEGWYKDGVRVSRNAAYTYTMTADDEQTLVAKFVSVAEDRKSLTCTVADGATIASGKYITVTNYQGVAFSMPIAFSALTKPTVSVKGLPKGLKYAGGEIKGASTVASKKDKKGRYVATATTFTMKTLAGNSAKYSVRFVTLPRPAWAVGTYDGAYNSEDALAGRSTLSVAATGAVSGKVFARIGGADVTATLAAVSIKAYDEARGVFLVEATMKGAGIEACKVEFTLAKGENGLGEAVAAADGDAMWLVQNVWKRTALKAPAFNTKKPLSLRLANGLALKFGAKGAVTFSGKVAGDDSEPVAVSGSAQLIACWDEESGTNAKLVVYAAPRANLANGVAEEIELHLKKNAKNVVTGVTEVTAAPALP